MDKAIIYSVYDFVNFHLCKTLLDQGVEVKGLYFHDPDEHFLEEKQLEVGRNANFQEIAWNDFDVKKSPKNTVIISLYDLYMLRKVSLLDHNLYNLTTGRHIEDLVLILPVQLSDGHSHVKDLLHLQAYLELARKITQNIYLFYLPTVYGPWQPATFLFQHTILNTMNRAQDFKEIRESTSDCLYIDDAVRTMLSILKARNPGNYLLESGLKNYWKQCADFIHVKQYPKTDEERFELNGEVEKITVSQMTPIADSFTSQVKHLEHLYPIKDF